MNASKQMLCALMLLSVLGLNGCGQKGALFMPDGEGAAGGTSEIQADKADKRKNRGQE